MVKNFTRKSLYNRIYKTVGFSKNFSSSVVDNFFEIMINEIIRKKKLKISNFGTFKVLNKKERLGRNPKNKIIATIKSRNVVNFKASNNFKRKINKK